MVQDKDILSDPSLKANPFSVPEGYSPGLENRVHGRIAAEDAPPETLWGRMKAPAMLALTFAVIFGMGYGVLSITGTSSPQSDFKTDGMADVLNEWSLPSTFIEDYYDEMNTDVALEHSMNTIQMTDELESEIMGLITMNDIMDNYQ